MLLVYFPSQINKYWLHNIKIKCPAFEVLFMLILLFSSISEKFGTILSRFVFHIANVSHTKKA